MQTRSPGEQEPVHRGILVQRTEYLQLGRRPAGSTAAQHHLGDALRPILFPVYNLQAEHLGMELHGRLQIENGKPDMVEGP